MTTYRVTSHFHNKRCRPFILVYNLVASRNNLWNTAMITLRSETKEKLTKQLTIWWKDGVSERNHNISVFYTSASPRAIESEQATEAVWSYVIPMAKSGIAEWTRYNCLLRNSLNKLAAQTNPHCNISQLKYVFFGGECVTCDGSKLTIRQTKLTDSLLQ